MDTPGLGVELPEFLRETAPEDLADVVISIAHASRDVAALIRLGPIAGALDAVVGVNSGGDAQKKLDIFADRTFERNLRKTSVRALASEERSDVTTLSEAGKYLVALDPLDGSSNIDVNITMGTIFSVLDAAGRLDFPQPGHK